MTVSSNRPGRSSVSNIGNKNKHLIRKQLAARRRNSNSAKKSKAKATILSSNNCNNPYKTSTIAKAEASLAVLNDAAVASTGTPTPTSTLATIAIPEKRQTKTKKLLRIIAPVAERVEQRLETTININARTRNASFQDDAEKRRGPNVKHNSDEVAITTTNTMTATTCLAETKTENVKNEGGGSVSPEELVPAVSENNNTHTISWVYNVNMTDVNRNAPRSASSSDGAEFAPYDELHTCIDTNYSNINVDNTTMEAAHALLLLKDQNHYRERNNMWVAV
jgi:hypothetical protein